MVLFVPLDMNPIIHYFRISYLFALALLFSSPTFLSAQTKNGFDLSNASIPVDEILSGGPPRDGIPSIDNPRFVSAEDAYYLQRKDQVLGIEIDEQARAYPLRILVWHEIVNDRLAGEPIVVTYCPLCGTAMVFRADPGVDARDFGVSGLLYNSDVLLYDRTNNSLWSQLKMEAVSGADVGTKLELLPSQLVTWEAWKKQHPDTQVLSTNTGHGRDYERQPYQGYEKSNRLMFPAANNDSVPFDNKTWVAGAVDGDQVVAFPIPKLPDNEAVTVKAGGNTYKATYDPQSEHVSIEKNGAQQPLATVKAYAFAWHAFYPNTVYWQISE